jgi:hypothetical protein
LCSINTWTSNLAFYYQYKVLCTRHNWMCYTFTGLVGVFTSWQTHEWHTVLWNYDNYNITRWWECFSSIIVLWGCHPICSSSLKHINITSSQGVKPSSYPYPHPIPDMQCLQVSGTFWFKMSKAELSLHLWQLPLLNFLPWSIPKKGHWGPILTLQESACTAVFVDAHTHDAWILGDYKDALSTVTPHLSSGQLVQCDMRNYKLCVI